MSHHVNLPTFVFFWKFSFKPQATWDSYNGQTCWEYEYERGCKRQKTKGKKVRTTSDDVGGKSVSEKSKSVGGQCVG